MDCEIMNKALTIIGTAYCLQDDIDHYGVVGDVMAINHAIMDYKSKIHHACMCEFMKLGTKFINIRNMYGLNTNFTMHTSAPHYLEYSHDYDIKLINEFQTILGIKVQCWDTRRAIRNSGILGAMIGIALGYKSIRLLGIPGEGSHYYDDMHNSDGKYFGVDFLSENVHLFSRVKSASGLTADILGKIELRG